MNVEPLKILLVDDVAENLVALEALLRRDGLVILTARSGAEALEPDSTTAATAAPKAWAADSNRTSIDGREKLTGWSIDSDSVPPRSTSRW